MPRPHRRLTLSGHPPDPVRRGAPPSLAGDQTLSSRWLDPVRRAALAGLAAGALLAGGAPLGASPLVAGYERFHAAEPDAAGGALLYSELGCASCHGGGPGLPARRGPDLGGLFQRASADWVRDFLARPMETKPGTAMPEMFSHLPQEESAVQVEAVLHHLMSLKPGGPSPRGGVPRHANAERGSALYHQRGCVACHAPSADHLPPAGAPGLGDFAYPHAPFPDLGAKYSLLSLASFLEDPAKARPDGRMPRFDLTPQDALDIASHLIGFQDSDPREAAPLPAFAPDPELARQGAELAARLNCAACHDLPGAEAAPPLALPEIPRPESGCLAPDPAPGLPRYPLAPGQRLSLARYLESPERDEMDAASLARLATRAFHCAACHSRDGEGGPDPARDRYFTGDEGIGDAGRLPPPLTGIGQKLRRDWLEGVLRGENQVRPYLETRMPAYPAHAEALAGLFAEADARPELPPLSAEADVEAGRKLLGVIGGVNCITCHTWGERPSLGIQALDLSNMARRFHPEWFRDYLLNPMAYRPGTLMPPLWPGGQSMNREVLDGDTERQIASIWAFLERGEGLPEGYPETAAGAFELIPGDRPLIQRTFFEGAGAHAILVGFPGGVHLAYDGLAGRPAMMWRGRFFDAYSTWFVRAAPFEHPLGEDALSWPPASAEEQEEGAYRGYRLDEGGVPVFLVTTGGVEVEERFEAGGGALRRELRWDPAAPEPAWTHPQGAAVAEAEGSAPGRRVYLYSWTP